MDGLFQDRFLTTPDVRILQETDLDQISVCEIELTTPTGDLLSAFYVKPKTNGKYPGILYCHWLEIASDANKTQFLEEAKHIAGQGYVCLLVDTVFANWPESRLSWTGTDTQFDRGIIMQQIRELRYCLAFLRAQPEVDCKRLALVGHDFGAMFNAILTGIEDDIKACVIMAAVPDFSDWFTLDKETTASERQAYYSDMADLAPVRYLAAAHQTTFLFQFGENDLFFVPKHLSELLVGNTGGPKSVKCYATDHALHHHPDATNDRVNWLRERLNSSK